MSQAGLRRGDGELSYQCSPSGVQLLHFLPRPRTGSNPLKLSGNVPVMDWFPASPLMVLLGALLIRKHCMREDGLTRTFVKFTDDWSGGWMVVGSRPHVRTR